MQLCEVQVKAFSVLYVTWQRECLLYCEHGCSVDTTQLIAFIMPYVTWQYECLLYCEHGCSVDTRQLIAFSILYVTWQHVYCTLSMAVQ